MRRAVLPVLLLALAVPAQASPGCLQITDLRGAPLGDVAPGERISVRSGTSAPCADPRADVVIRLEGHGTVLGRVQADAWGAYVLPSARVPRGMRPGVDRLVVETTRRGKDVAYGWPLAVRAASARVPEPVRDTTALALWTGLLGTVALTGVGLAFRSWRLARAEERDVEAALAGPPALSPEDAELAWLRAMEPRRPRLRVVASQELTAGDSPEQDGRPDEAHRPFQRSAPGVGGPYPGLRGDDLGGGGPAPGGAPTATRAAAAPAVARRRAGAAVSRLATRLILAVVRSRRAG